MLGKTRIWVAGWVSMVSWLGWAETSQNPQITVFVVERAGTSSQLLVDAEQNAARVFRQAGVEVEWVNCGQTKPERNCESLSGADLIVHLVPRSRTLSADFFGVAFVDHDAGTYADVFLDSIQQLREQDRGIALAAILGSVLAHEIGHLLLGPNAHAREGIMQPHWETEQLRSMARGQMRFTREQAGRIQARALVLHSRDGSILAAMSEP